MDRGVRRMNSMRLSEDDSDSADILHVARTSPRQALKRASAGTSPGDVRSPAALVSSSLSLCPSPTASTRSNAGLARRRDPRDQRRRDGG
jgi:hypothetical protein